VSAGAAGLMAAAAMLVGSAPVSVQAQSCTATATSINFGNVSPIRLNAIDATGTVNVTCTWPAVTVNRNARVCLNLGNGTGSTSFVPRHLVNGTNRARFNLYRDAARSQIWGSLNSTTAPTPISLLLSKPALGTVARSTVTYYGRLEADQPDVPIVGGNPTLYTSAFSGTHTSLNVHFFEIFDRNCNQVPQASGSFPFSAQATIVDDCTIEATDLNFPRTGLLDEPLQASGGLSVQCTNGNAWRISLDGGSSGSAADRRMQRVGGGGSVAYQLYTDSSRSLIWGDGSGGTGRVTGTGTGQSQPIAVHGTVPAQPTPQPGSYRDTITATISF